MKAYFSKLRIQTNNKAKEASLSILGISQPELRNHLSQQMTQCEAFVTHLFLNLCLVGKNIFIKWKN